MSGTILLADDSLTIQKVIELTFAETGFDVIAVSSGEELMQKLPECRPDIVICDVIMPGKDGYEVCQEIKSEPDSLHIPVILLTGTFEPFDKDRALAAGCSEIITKPFEARKLVDAVERLVRQDAGAPVSQTSPSNDGSVRPPVFEGQVTPPAPHYEGQVMPPAATPVDEVDEFDEIDEIDEGNFETKFIEPPAAEAVPEAAPEAFPEFPSEPAESLDFTSTGFSEMEAAGQRDQEAFGAPPEHGLEYDFDSGPTTETPIPSVDTGPVEPYHPPETLEFSAPHSADESSTADPVDTSEDEFEFGGSSAPASVQGDAPEATSNEQDWNGPPAEPDEPDEPEEIEVAPSDWHDTPSSAGGEQDADTTNASTLSPSADTGPIDPEVVSSYADTAPVEPELPAEEPVYAASTEVVEEPEELPYEDESLEEEEEVLPQPVFGGTADTVEDVSDEVEAVPYEEEAAPYEAEAAPYEEEAAPYEAEAAPYEAEAAPFEEEAAPYEAEQETGEADADDAIQDDSATAPDEFSDEPAQLPPMAEAEAPMAEAEAPMAEAEAPIPAEEAPSEIPAVIPAVIPNVAAQASALSDEDIDRIARRVLELASEKIEMIAWEVIPDMAEIVVRERIRELEATVEDVESNSSETFQ